MVTISEDFLNQFAALFGSLLTARFVVFFFVVVVVVFLRENRHVLVFLSKSPFFFSSQVLVAFLTLFDALRRVYIQACATATCKNAFDVFYGKFISTTTKKYQKCQSILFFIMLVPFIYLLTDSKLKYYDKD